MGRPLRRLAPGQSYLVTTRCHQARFFLRPDPELNEVVLEWLARAQRAFPGLRIHAVCSMSNHLHLVVRDDRSELSAWASYFLGNLSRAVNRLRGRTGACFERRYSAEPILDPEALVDRLVYVVTNPVQAALCPRVGQWPGVLLYAEGSVPVERRVTWVDPEARRRASTSLVRPREALPGGEPERVEGHLIIDPVPHDGAGPPGVSEAVAAREKALAAERRASRRKALTPDRILAQPWQAAPTQPKHARRPLCHAADPGLRQAFLEGFRQFVALFREAAAELRRGSLHVPFPDWSFPPGRPLVRPALAPGA